ncbi:hypothetical protein E2542_SST00198 [Spatholobus suberectus]|nr:hypothetical protein E2542_SST00198 [Spatholobus suberectus]
MDVDELSERNIMTFFTLVTTLNSLLLVVVEDKRFLMCAGLLKLPSASDREEVVACEKHSCECSPLLHMRG